MDGPFYIDGLPPFNITDSSSVTLTASLQVVSTLDKLPKFPSNYFGYVGKAIRITAIGRATSGATPGGFNWGVYWGPGTAGSGTLISGVNVTWTASQTNATMVYTGIIRCRALGTSGSLLGCGRLFIQQTGEIPCPFSGLAATTVDLTQNYYMFPQLSRSGSTVETFQLHDWFTEALN
jgi:hypothetical protein